MTSQGTFAFAGQEVARERLAAYQRYALLVAAQDEALERDDLETFAELAREALELQAQVGTPAPAESGDPASQSAIAGLLTESLVCQRRIQARLRLLREEVAEEVRTALDARPRIRSYLDAEPREGRPSLDVRL